MKTFKRLLTLSLIAALAVQVWGTDPAVDDVIFKEEWGGNNIQANAYTFTGTTTWSGLTTGLSYSSDNNQSLLSSATAGGITTDNFFFLKNSESTLTMSGIAIPSNVTEINVSFASNKNIIQCTYSFDGSSYETGATSINGTQDFDIDCTDESTLYLKFKKKGTSSNARLDNIVITVTEVTGGGATKYTVTLASGGSVTGGTFVASPTSAAKDATVTLTATPTTHYSLSSWTVTKEGGGSVSTTPTGTNTATFAMPEDNVTVSATFTEATKHTVKFYNNGEELTSERIEVYDGEAIGTLPSLASGDACDETSTTFMGWTTSTISTKTSSAPTFIDAETIIDADKNYNAVWAKASSGGSSGTVTASLSELKSAVSGISSGYHSVSFDLSETGDDYSCNVTATKSTQSATSGWMQVGKASDSRYITISTELPGVITNISSSSVFNGSASTWSGTVYYNTSPSVSTPKASKAFSSVNAFSLDVEGGTKDGYILFSSAICLGDLSITYSTVSYSDYVTLCGATISAATDYYITSTKNQNVKISIPVSAYNFESTSTLNASISEAGFSLVGWTDKTITAGVTLNTEVIVQYCPSVSGTSENATLTLSASPADNKSITIHGRSLPESFAIIANSSGDFALAANMTGSTDSRKAQAVTIAGGTVKCTPAVFTYTLEGVTDARYATHGTAVRLKGATTGKYLKAIGSDSNDFKNADYEDSDLFEWLLITDDNTNYNIQCFDAATATATRMIRYRSDGHFGNYTKTTGGQAILQLLEVEANCMPRKVLVDEITHNSIKIKFQGTDAEHTLVIKQGSTTVVNKTVTNGEVISGLTASTDYTYTLTPGCSANCAVEGVFSTLAAPITITLHCDGKTETLTDVANPYTLPAFVDICDGWAFAGWSTSEVAEHSGSFSPITEATANGDYYAVFQTEGGSTTYTKVTSNSGLIAGKLYVIGYSTGTNELVVAGDISSQVLTTVTGSTYSTSTSTISALGTGAVVFTLGGSSGAWTLSKTTQKLGATTTKKLAWDNGTQTWSIDISSGDATISNTNEDYGTMYYNTSAPRFTTYSSAGTTGELPSLFVASGGVEFSSTTDCKDCTSAGASFAMGNIVNKSTESAIFTNAVQYTKTNTKPQIWSSSNSDVAEVNASSGEITIKALGSTTITVTQVLDDTNDPDNTCAVNISYMLNINPPSVDVVEVTADDKIIIEHNIDNTNSTLIVQEQETGISGNVANDIFFSKYFEASSNMKLFALYNGTTHNIDMSKLRVRSRTGDVQAGTQKGWSTSGEHNYIEFGTIEKLGKDYPDYMLPPFTELIFWSNNYGSGAAAGYNATLRGCIAMEIGDNTYDFDDMKDGNIPNWYCLGSYSSYVSPDADGNYAMVFNGDDPLILERTEDGGESWTPIDLLGAGTAVAPSNVTYVTTNEKPTTILEGGPVVNGKIKKVTAGGSPKISYDNEKYTINEHDDVPLNDDPGGYWALPEGASMPLSTNRYYLIRKNTVKDGQNAVTSNTTVFATLATEWTGEPVGGNRDADCYSGKMFSEVGKYDYSHYFETWDDVSINEGDFQKLTDGTYSIHVDNLASHSCKTLRIKIADKEDPTDIKASVEYKVPIIVKDGTKSTNDGIFTGAGFGKEICSTCDVVILDGATLEASDALSAVKEVRNIEVYAGGMLNIDGTKELTVKQLIMRSKDDVVSRAKLASTNFNRRNKTILFDKRITGTRWYWIALPYDWKMEDVKFRNGDDAVYNTDWWLRTYDGQQRATGDQSQSSNWPRVPAGSTLNAGKGYILAVNTLDGHTHGELRFSMDAPLLDKDRNVIVPVNAWGATTDKDPNHLGWNLIGNPYLNDYEYSGLPDILTVGELWFNTATGLYELDKTGGLRYVVEADDPSGYGEYHQEELANNKLLEPFKTYFVQIDGTSAGQERNIEFTYASEHLRKSPIHRAPEEYLDEREDDIIWVPITLSNVLDEHDVTTFLVSDRFTDKYDMMDDLTKWRRAYYEYYTKPVIASRNLDGELAFNALPDSSAAAGIPLNYFAYSSGMYTICLDHKYGVDNIDKAILYDAVAKKEHDLKAEGEYTFSSNRTDNTTRFTLYIQVNRHRIPTGFENIEWAENPRKLLINGNVYIQRGNRIYDITGKEVLNK